MQGGLFMKDIAIYFQKFDLGNGRHIFRPINTIRGVYDKKDETFITDCGVVCESITGWSNDSSNFFGFPTTIIDLKKMYKEKNSEEALMHEYFRRCTQYYYIGYYDYMDSKLVTKKISFNKFDNYLNPISVRNCEAKTSSGNFGLKELIDLKSSESLRDVKAKIDRLINTLYDPNEIKKYEDNSNYNKSDINLDFDLGNITPYTILNIEERYYTKKELMKIVKARIKHINSLSMNGAQAGKEIDCILDSYNEIVYTKQKKKRI